MKTSPTKEKADDVSASPAFIFLHRIIANAWYG
jgi:hypothetical protein